MSGEAAADYARRAAQVLDGVEYGPKHVLSVDDAEILALDGPDAARVAPLLRLGPTVSDQQRELAVEAASRRLFDARATEDGTPLGGDGSDSEEPTARTVLRMRRSWLCLLALNQNTALGRQFTAMYLRADRRAMTEVVTPDGRHQFTALTRAAALDVAAELLTPFADTTSEDGPGRAYPIATWKADVGDELAQAKIASNVVSRRQNRAMTERVEERFAVYNFDDRTELFAPESAERIRIAPASRRTLRRRLEDMTRPLDPESGNPDE